MPLDPIAYKPYADPDDFIREVTDLIWVQRAIGFIRENYEPDSIVHTGYGTITTREEVIAGSADAAGRPRRDAHRSGRGRGLGGPRRRRLPELAPGLRRRTRQPVLLTAPSPTASTGAAGWSRNGWSGTTSPRRCRPGSIPTRWPARKYFRGYLGSMTEQPPADVLAAGDSGPRPDDYRSECRDGAGLHPAGLERPRPGEGHPVHAPRPVPARPSATAPRSGPRATGGPCSSCSALPERPVPGPRPSDQLLGRLRRVCAIAVCWVLVGNYDGQADFGPLTGRRIDLLGVSQFLVQNGKIVRETRIYDEIAATGADQRRSRRRADPLPNIY